MSLNLILTTKSFIGPYRGLISMTVFSGSLGLIMAFSIKSLNTWASSRGLRALKTESMVLLPKLSMSPRRKLMPPFFLNQLGEQSFMRTSRGKFAQLVGTLIACLIAASWQSLLNSTPLGVIKRPPWRLWTQYWLTEGASISMLNLINFKLTLGVKLIQVLKLSKFALYEHCH